MDLSQEDIRRAKETFLVYDFDESDSIDGFYIGPALRALGLTPSLALVGKLGGTATKGNKKLKVEEFLAIYNDAKKDKDFGTMFDYLECMRSNDKEQDGTISVAQLSHILQTYGNGERLDPEEIQEIFEDCGDACEGHIRYVPFLQKLLNDFDKSHASIEPPPYSKPSSLSSGETSENQEQLSHIEDTNPVENITNVVSVSKPRKPKPPKTISLEQVKAEAEAKEAALEAELKPKNQQPLISMMTKGLIHNIK